MDQAPARSYELPELAISTEKVCQLIEEARELQGRFPATAPVGTTEDDQGVMHELQDEPDEPFMLRMREFFAGLSLEEKANLLALLWLGRGDIGLSDWRASVAEAERRIEEKDVTFPFDDEGMAENLATGLECFDRSCLP